jgi:hypothetical protein
LLEVRQVARADGFTMLKLTSITSQQSSPTARDNIACPVSEQKFSVIPRKRILPQPFAPDPTRGYRRRAKRRRHRRPVVRGASRRYGAPKSRNANRTRSSPALGAGRIGECTAVDLPREIDAQKRRDGGKDVDGQGEAIVGARRSLPGPLQEQWHAQDLLGVLAPLRDAPALFGSEGPAVVRRDHDERAIVEAGGPEARDEVAENPVDEGELEQVALAPMNCCACRPRSRNRSLFQRFMTSGSGPSKCFQFWVTSGRPRVRSSGRSTWT